MKRISICDEHGIWLGSCVLGQGGRITHCPVVLAEDRRESERLYRDMEKMIAEGHSRGQVGPYAYELYEAAA